MAHWSKQAQKLSTKAIIFFTLVLSLRPAIKEKRLTHDRLQTIDVERFGDEKSGLWRCSGEKSFRICSDENHRHGDRFQNLIDCLKTRASVCKLDIREYEPGLLAPRRFDRLEMGARDIDDPVPLLLYQRLKIEGNEGFVLDDENIGADLIGNLFARGVNKSRRVVHGAIQRLRDLKCIEAFERAE